MLRVSFPDFQGKPSEEGNADWKRRHIPIVGIASEGPLADMTPRLPPHAKPKDAVGTSIGGGYKPTLYWLDGSSLRYTRLGATGWEPVRSIAIDETMTYETGARPRRRHGQPQLTVASRSTTRLRLRRIGLRLARLRARPQA